MENQSLYFKSNLPYISFLTTKKQDSENWSTLGSGYIKVATIIATCDFHCFLYRTLTFSNINLLSLEAIWWICGYMAAILKIKKLCSMFLCMDYCLFGICRRLRFASRVEIFNASCDFYRQRRYILKGTISYPYWI